MSETDSMREVAQDRCPSKVIRVGGVPSLVHRGWFSAHHDGRSRTLLMSQRQ